MIIGYSRTFSSGSAPTTNLTTQFDASSLSYLWKTYSGSNPIYSNQATADGDDIRVWNSIVPASTSDWTYFQDGVSGGGPTLKITSPGLQHQCLQFNGSNDFLTFGDRLGSSLKFTDQFSTTASTIFIAFRIDTMPGAGSFAPLIFAASGNYWGLRVQGTSGKIAYLMHDAGGYTGHEGDAISVNTNYVAMMKHDTTTIYGAINNGTVSTSSSGTFDQGTVTQLMGSDSGLGFHLTGRIGEVLTYNAVLGATDTTNAWNYLMNKWL